ncbi:uncharacterized protein N7506_001956 [Penicillium brevicompactum]|uniref:uncharacterized protein n=1 Tax=Penicillium brevicompactum TaxID=5074 RepID=UPI00254235D5|nr:uncharacterized protein N7506_001956 [Penicillium brevicompactum]KAJ5348703.1 hypothetical protein N7506_001956 [Penicillium brevicompactum]
MQFSLSAISALAATATAMSLTESNALGGAKAQCESGDIACCDSKETLSGDGILGNLLAKGALNGLLGNDDAACAKTSALDDLNVLAQTKDTNEGPSCKNIIACCPSGSGKCTALDN